MMVLLVRRKKLSKRYKLFLGDCLEVMKQILCDYTEGVSATAHYSTLGNGWTASVIEWFFKGLTKEYK